MGSCLYGGLMEPVWGSWTGGKHRLKAGSTSEPQCYLDTSPWWPLTIRLRWDRWAVWQPDNQKKYSRETAFLVKVVKCSIFICQRMWSDLSCKHSGSEQYVPVRHHYKKTFKNSLLDRRNNVQKLHKSVAATHIPGNVLFSFYKRRDSLSHKNSE